MIVEMGDALVLVPHDEALAAVTARLEAALEGAGAGTDHLIKAAAETRAEITQEEFGDEGD